MIIITTITIRTGQPYSVADWRGLFVICGRAEPNAGYFRQPGHTKQCFCSVNTLEKIESIEFVSLL